MTPGEVRGRLAAMESRHLVGSRQDKATMPLRRVYAITAEGRRKAGVSDARSTTLQRDDAET